MFPGQRHDDAARRHKGFLVGQRDAFARPDGRHGGHQPHRSDHCRQHGIHGRQRDHFKQRFRPSRHAGSGIRDRLGQPPGQRSSATTANSGCTRRICDSILWMSEPAAMAPTRMPKCRHTSMACVPMEPVEPRMATHAVMFKALQCPEIEVNGRRDEQDAVEPVQNAAMSGDELAKVLDARAALDGRGGPVPQLGDEAAQQAQQQEMVPGHIRTHRLGNDEAKARHDAMQPMTPPMAPSTVFLGLTSGSSLRRPRVTPEK